MKEAAVDASLAICAVIQDEPNQEKARRFFDNSMRSNVVLIAPPLFESEADSALRRLVYRGILTEEAGRAAQSVLDAFPIRIIYDPRGRARAREIAERFQQDRVYDATYAALAELRECELWTGDKAFYDAVRGVLRFVRYIGDYEGSADEQKA